MAYEKIVQIIEASQAELAHQTIDNCLKYNYLAAGKFNYDAQSGSFENTYGIIARYIQHGNPAEWTEFIQQTSRHYLDKGAKPDLVISIGTLMVDLLKELIAQQMPGSQNETERKKLYSRLDNMHSMAKLTVTVTHLKDAPKNEKELDKDKKEKELTQNERETKG